MGNFVIFCTDYNSRKRPNTQKLQNIIHTKINALMFQDILLTLNIFVHCGRNICKKKVSQTYVIFRKGLLVC